MKRKFGRRYYGRKRSKITKSKLEKKGGWICYIPDFRFLREFKITYEKDESAYYKSDGDYFVEHPDYGIHDFVRGIHYVVLSNIGGIEDTRSYGELKGLMDEINDFPQRFIITEDFRVARLLKKEEKKEV